MNTEHLGELFAAMAAARQEFGTFAKSKTANMGTFTYSYADLSDIIEATAAALAKHGLVIIQEPVVVTENGQTTVVVNGCIGHKAGGLYELKPLSLPVAAKTAQAVGSAISYARRYQLSAILNLAASDDDAQAAENATAGAQRSQTPAKAQAPAPAPNTAQRASTPAKSDSKQYATEEQMERLASLGLDFYGPEEWEEQKPKLCRAVSKGTADTIADLLEVEAAKLIAGLEKKMAEVATMKEAA